jgi:hypothetical protein
VYQEEEEEEEEETEVLSAAEAGGDVLSEVLSGVGAAEVMARTALPFEPFDARGYYEALLADPASSPPRRASPPPAAIPRRRGAAGRAADGGGGADCSGGAPERGDAEAGPVWEGSEAEAGPVWEGSEAEAGPVWEGSEAEAGPVWEGSEAEAGPESVSPSPEWEEGGEPLEPLAPRSPPVAERGDGWAQPQRRLRPHDPAARVPAADQQQQQQQQQQPTQPHEQRPRYMVSQAPPCSPAPVPHAQSGSAGPPALVYSLQPLHKDTVYSRFTKTPGAGDGGAGRAAGAAARGGGQHARAAHRIGRRGRYRRGAGILYPPPPSRTKWTRRVPHPVLIGHAASLTPY